MSTKKSTIARHQSAPQTPHKETELAAHIAAVLAHPYTPTSLYNAIVDELTSLTSVIPARETSETPEMIERVLNWHQGFGFRLIEGQEEYTHGK